MRKSPKDIELSQRRYDLGSQLLQLSPNLLIDNRVLQVDSLAKNLNELKNPYVDVDPRGVLELPEDADVHLPQTADIVRLVLPMPDWVETYQAVQKVADCDLARGRIELLGLRLVLQLQTLHDK
ncbi:MAG: hypothetical protein V2I33_19510, partial [Kangiellaceae bacterium]|nr:hypothetical protein [Kangiellaceae bacterium]